MASTTRYKEPSLPTLTRLLTSLSADVLSSSPSNKSTQYDRNRINANVEHARTMLLTLEKQSSTNRVANQRQQTQADLQGKRDVIKQLQARLEEMDRQDSDDEDDEDEDENAAAQSYGPARTDTASGLDSGEPQGTRLSPTEQSELRSRKPPSRSSKSTPNTASTTGREELFTGRKADAETSELRNHEALESHNRTQQAVLEQGLLSLVQSLKQSSLNIGVSLEADREVQARAQGGLEKTSGEMDAAQRSMGMLRRMSEGQGWWGRIKLYAFIFALWVACFLLVFVGPKLRF